MVGTFIKLGLVAGLLAGVLAGLLAQVAAEPSIDAAIAIEEAAEVEGAAHTGTDADDDISRTTQKVGLVVGTGLFGAALGAAFGVALAWSHGRIAGTVWQRALKIGTAVAFAAVLLPAAKYPANPPAVGDPATVGNRTGLYLLLVAVGLALVVAAPVAMRRLRANGVAEHLVQVLTGGGVLLVAVTVGVLLPSIEGAGSFPADTLWSFRLGSLATQLTLVGGTAVGLGLLATSREADSESVCDAAPVSSR